MSDLVELQRNNFLHHLDQVHTSNGLKYLVVDETTEHLIYALIDQKELLRTVTAVERIDHKRKSQTSIDAVYIIDPTRFSLACLKTDFKVSPPRYKSMAIYLLPSPSVGTVIQDFTHNNNPIYNQLIRFIKVFNFNYMPIDKYVFLSTYDTTQDSLRPVQKDFDDNDPKLFEKARQDEQAFSDKLLLNNYSLQIYYNPAFRKLVNYQIEMVANSLLNLCIVTNEYPVVRYYSPKLSLNDSTLVSKIIAGKVQEKIDDYVRKNPDFFSRTNGGPSASTDNTILLITDRTLDVIEMFLHEFNYESMVYDFLDKKEFNSKNSIVFYNVENANGRGLKKVSKISQRGNDKYFNKYRHMHISTAYDSLNKDVKKLLEDNPMLVNTANANSTTDILHMMAHTQEFNDERRLLTLHKQLIERMLHLNLKAKLHEISDIEQILAAGGTDVNNQMVKLQELTNDLIVKLDEMKQLDINHRIRLIILFALTKKDGILVSDLTKLFKFLGVYRQHEMDSYIQLFKNFNMLNRDIIKLASSSNSGRHHHHSSSHAKKNKPKEYYKIDNTEFNTSRYKPALYKILSDLAIGNQAELQEFPFVKEAIGTLYEEAATGGSGNASGGGSTSLRNQNLVATWHTPAKSRKRQKMFVYMVGGITTAEIKAVYDLSEKLNRDIYLGSENILVPNETVFNVRNLSNPEPRDLNPLIPHKLSRESNDKVPECLFDNGFNKPAPIVPPQQQQQLPIAHQKPLSQAPSSGKSNGSSSKPEKKHKFGKFLKKSK